MARLFTDRHGVVEVGAITDMVTGTALNIDAKQDAILVVIDAYLSDTPHQTAGRGFVPKPLTAATPVNSFA